MATVFTLMADYIDYVGLRVTGLSATNSGPPIWGWINENATGIKLTRCTVDNIGGQGFYETQPLVQLILIVMYTIVDDLLVALPGVVVMDLAQQVMEILQQI